jgi:hypothetical protein
MEAQQFSPDEEYLELTIVVHFDSDVPDNDLPKIQW